MEEPHEISKVIVEFYQNLLGRRPSGAGLDVDLLRRTLPKRIPDEHIQTLDRDVSFEEIKEVLFSLKDNKAPRPDGFNAGFFKRAWSIVGNDVLCAIKPFFDSGRLSKQVNATAIALVPKIPNPSQSSWCCQTLLDLNKLLLLKGEISAIISFFPKSC